MTYREITLDTVAGGALPELFEHVLADVLRNLKDPNADSSVKRKIKIELAFTPMLDGSGRGPAQVEARVTSVLAPPVKSKSLVYVAGHGDDVRGYVDDPSQAELFDPNTGEVPLDDPDVRPIQGAGS